MALLDYLKNIEDEISQIFDEDYDIKIASADTVPNFSDSAITFDNLIGKSKSCKTIKTCVLYIDIRDSVKINNSNEIDLLVRLYSIFLRSMISCARRFGGHVRNIIGDRIMVVFDSESCFSSAYKTAVLMNTVANYIISGKATHLDFKCGIGIDAGEMLITKGGVVRKGGETEFYRGLVWLGRPANIASRLTDLANKTISQNRSIVRQGNYYEYIDEWHWFNIDMKLFLGNLVNNYDGTLSYEDKYCKTFYITDSQTSIKYPPILVSEEFLRGLALDDPNNKSIKNNWFKEINVKIDEYNGKIYGGSVYYTEVDSL